MLGSTLLLGLLLALASGAAWTGLDAVRKRLAADLSPLAILLGLTATQLPLHGAFVWAAPPARVDVLPFLGWSGLAAANAIAANGLLVVAVRTSPLSLTTPFLSFTPVATLLTGWLLLGQRPAPVALAGVAAVVVGALLLNATPRQALRAPLHGLREPGSRLALVVALLFALGNAVDRRAVLHASEPLYALTVNGLVAVTLAAFPRLRRELRDRPRALATLAAGGAIMAAALLLQLFAFRYLYVAYVDAVKRGGGNLFAVAFGRVFFGERGARRQLLAALVMSAGIALVVWRGSAG